MNRLLLVLGAVALIVVGLVVLGGDGGTPPHGDLLADGEARVSGVASGLLGASVRPAGGSPGADPAPATGRKEVTGPYEFRVISAETNLALAGVEIDTEEGERIGATGPDGHLRIEDGGETPLRYRTRFEGFLPHRGVAVPSEPAAFALQPGVPIRGRVIDDSSGAPAPYARLQVWDVDLGRKIASPSADGEGRFRIPAVRPNRPFLIVTHADGYVPHRQTENFDVAINDLEIRVGGGGVLTGVVLDVNQRPYAGREVRLVRAGEPLQEHRPPRSKKAGVLPGLTDALVARTTTDGYGRYVFRGLARGGGHEAAVLLAYRYEARSSPVRFANDDETLERDILIPHPASLKISIEDEHRRILKQALVSVRSGKNHWKVLPKDRRPDGTLLLSPVTPSTVRVRVRIPTAPAPPETPEPVTLEPEGEETVVVVFPSGKTFAGRVLDREGEPIWKAKVFWYAMSPKESAGATTDSSGRFRLTRLAAAAADVTVSARDVPRSPSGYETTVVLGVAAGTEIEVRLKDGTKVHGHFPDLEKNDQVEAMLGSARSSLWLGRGGAFTFRGPAPESPGVFVFHTPGYPPLIVVQKLPFRSEEDRDIGDLYFAAANPFLGQVVDARGKPIRAAKVSVQASWSDETQRTDRDGYFELGRVPQRRVSVRVDAPGHPPNNTTMLPASQHIRQVIEIYEAGSIALTVVDPRKRPMKRALVQYQSAGDFDKRRKARMKWARTDAKGFLKLQLKPDTYVLTTSIRGTALSAEIRVEVRAGKAGKHTLRLETRMQRLVRERAEKRK